MVHPRRVDGARTWTRPSSSGRAELAHPSRRAAARPPTYVPSPRRGRRSRIRDDPFTERMNGLPKYVASHTLTEAPWSPSTILSGDSSSRSPSSRSSPAVEAAAARLGRGCRSHPRPARPDPHRDRATSLRPCGSGPSCSSSRRPDGSTSRPSSRRNLAHRSSARRTSALSPYGAGDLGRGSPG